MKTFCCCVAMLAICSVSTAADYSTAQLAADGSNLWNIGTQVAGDDIGGGNSVGLVNGVDFDLGGVDDNFGGDIDDRNAVSTYFDSGDALLGEIMNDIKFTGGASPVAVAFSGLEVGVPYVAQFLSWDAEVEAEGGPGIDKELRHTVISSSIDGNTHIQEQIVGGDGSDSQLILPVVTTVEFVANDPTATFSFALDPARTFDDNAIINGATLFRVPEPASALLVLSGLAALCLGRRK